MYELAEHQGEPYVVMEHSPGLFLATAMETALLLGRTLAPAHAVYIAAQVADALHYAWNSQDEEDRPLHVVHRAVSPMSIRLESSGRVKLIDFGVAYSRMVGRLDTPSKVLRAELDYAAPEVMRHQEPDGRADLYSLGMVLLEMLSGQYMKNSAHLTKKKLTVHLGEMLREARLEAELTQADVAERVGVVTEVYGRMERGNLTPSVLTLRKLCMVLRVDASAALGLQTGEATAWLKESEPTPEESPQMRRLLRTLRQLDDKQLTAVGYMARSLVPPEAR